MCFKECGIQLKNKDLLPYINQSKGIRRVQQAAEELVRGGRLGFSGI
jgi:hypothetical protein